LQKFLQTAFTRCSPADRGARAITGVLGGIFELIRDLTHVRRFIETLQYCCTPAAPRMSISADYRTRL
jgi:hypothetical protein